MLIFVVPVEQQTNILDLFSNGMVDVEAGLFHYLPAYKTVDAVLVFQVIRCGMEKISSEAQTV
jgi:hypothetical protein